MTRKQNKKAPLVADPTGGNFNTRQNPPICNPPLDIGKHFYLILPNELINEGGFL